MTGTVSKGTYYCHIYDNDLPCVTNQTPIDRIVIIAGEEPEINPTIETMLNKNIAADIDHNLTEIVFVSSVTVHHKNSDLVKSNSMKKIFKSGIVDKCETRGIELILDNWAWYFGQFARINLMPGRRRDPDNPDTNHLIGTPDLENPPNPLLKMENCTDTSRLIRPYLTYMGKMRDHRTDWILALEEHGMIDHLPERKSVIPKGLVRYNWRFLADDPIDPDRWIMPRHMEHAGFLKSDFLVSQDGSTYSSDHDLLPEGELNHNFIDSYNITDEFLEGFLHVVPETLCEGDDLNDWEDHYPSNRMFATEKTFIPMMFMRPVIVISNPGFHSYLEDMGFHLFTEIFDYEFDKMTNRAQRLEAIIEQIKELDERRSEWPELYKKILPKLKHNRDLIINSISEPRYYPHVYYDLIYNTPNPAHESLDDIDYLFDKFFCSQQNYAWMNAKLPPCRTLNVTNMSEPAVKSFLDYVNLAVNQPWFKNQILFQNSFEWEPWFDHRIVNFINRFSELKSTAFFFSPQHYLDEIEPDIHQCKLVSYPWYFCDATYNQLKDRDTPVPEYWSHVDIQYKGICLLARPHKHRIYLLKNMTDIGLTHDPWLALSYNGNDYVPELFTYYDDPYITDKSVIHQRLPLDSWNTHMDSLLVPPEYHVSFCDFVTESTHTTQVFSEKVFKPLYMKKPFLILGAQNHNIYLRDQYGIELYDDIFDYEFDKHPDLETRSELYAQEMKKVMMMSTDELRGILEVIWPKLERNRSIMDNYITDGDIPDELLDYYAEIINFSDTHNERRAFDRNMEFRMGDEVFEERVRRCIKRRNT